MDIQSKLKNSRLTFIENYPSDNAAAKVTYSVSTLPNNLSDYDLMLRAILIREDYVVWLRLPWEVIVLLHNALQLPSVSYFVLPGQILRSGLEEHRWDVLQGVEPSLSLIDLTWVVITSKHVPKSNSSAYILKQRK